jgi:hypothetical protein
LWSVHDYFTLAEYLIQQHIAPGAIMILEKLKEMGMLTKFIFVSKKAFPKILCIALVAFTLVSCNKNKQQEAKKYSYELFTRVIGKKGNHGTGVIISTDSGLFILSALHVFTSTDPSTGKSTSEDGMPKAEQVRIAQADGSKVDSVSFPLQASSGILYKFPDSNFFVDAALLPIRSDSRIKHVYQIELADFNEPLSVSDSIFYWGYPVNEYGSVEREPKLISGFVSDTSRGGGKSIGARIYWAHGSSGAPIFKINDAGDMRLIGIVTSAKTDGNVEILPIRTIFEALHLQIPKANK